MGRQVELYRSGGCKTVRRPEQNNLEGHGMHDLRTESAQKQRSASRHRDEEYEPSSEDPRQPPRGANRHE